MNWDELERSVRSESSLQGQHSTFSEESAEMLRVVESAERLSKRESSVKRSSCSQRRPFEPRSESEAVNVWECPTSLLQVPGTPKRFKLSLNRTNRINKKAPQSSELSVSRSAAKQETDNKRNTSPSSESVASKASQTLETANIGNKSRRPRGAPAAQAIASKPATDATAGMRNTAPSQLRRRLSLCSREELIELMLHELHPPRGPHNPYKITYSTLKALYSTK